MKPLIPFLPSHKKFKKPLDINKKKKKAHNHFKYRLKTEQPTDNTRVNIKEAIRVSPARRHSYLDQLIKKTRIESHRYAPRLQSLDMEREESKK